MWTSPYDPLPADPPLSLDLVAEAAARSGAGPALIDAADGTGIAHRTLPGRIARAASSLSTRGFGPGDVLALWAPNSPDWAVAALGAMAAGGAVTGISPVAADGEVTALLARTRESPGSSSTSTTATGRAC